MKIACTLMLFLQVGGILTADSSGDQANHNGLCPENEEHIVTYRMCSTKSINTDAVNCNTEIDNLKICTKQLVNSAKACFKLDQNKTFDFVYKFANATLNVECGNNTGVQNAKKCDALEGKPVTEKQAMDGCVQRSNSTRNQHNGAKNIYDAEDCGYLQAFEDCSIAAASCSYPHSNLLEMVYKYVNDEIPCEKLLKSTMPGDDLTKPEMPDDGLPKPKMPGDVSPKSKASTTAGVVSVLLLITAAINMYL